MNKNILMVAVLLPLSMMSMQLPTNKLSQELIEESITGNTQKMRDLINRGANVNYIDIRVNSKGTALAQASAWGRIEAMKLLLDAGANPNQITNYGNVPLSYVLTAYAQTRLLSKQRALDAAALLLNAGANPNERSVNELVRKYLELAAFLKEAHDNALKTKLP